jgi:hypothetical protein
LTIYHPRVRWLLIVYAAGVLLALWRTDARLPARVAIALLWPVGPIAFVVTVSILLAASAIAFPAVGAALLVGGGIAWWALS